MSGKKKAKPQRTKMKTKNESLCIPVQERRVEDNFRSKPPLNVVYFWLIKVKR